MPEPDRLLRTAHVGDFTGLAFRSPTPDVHAWIHRGQGMLGWGELASIRCSGPDALGQVAAWFDEQRRDLLVDDEVRRPGSGPIAFVSGAFDPARSQTVAIIPRTVLGRDEFGAWITHAGDQSALPPPRHASSPGAVRYDDQPAGAAAFEAAVRDGVDRIRAGRLDKVVLGRQLTAHAERQIDPRFLVQSLATAYDSCWTSAVDGLIGATPELLVRLVDGHVYSRVLAGTEWGAGAYRRLRSAKNREEHEYAAASAAEALAKVTIRLDVPGEPKILELPNVSHLATEIRGDVADGITACDVAAAMHPTAAVGGTPRELACACIAELEVDDRGRCAGPVGWIDGHGNGEFGLALRGGQLLDDHSISLFAGCGIVADSDPATELAESTNKLVVMRAAMDGALSRDTARPNRHDAAPPSHHDTAPTLAAIVGRRKCR